MHICILMFGDYFKNMWSIVLGYLGDGS